MSGQERLFETALEIELQGDLKTLCSIIDRMTKELRFEGCAYEARQYSKEVTETFVWYDVLYLDPSRISHIPIGAFTMQSLINNRVILTVPPRSKWILGGLSSKELMIIGYEENKYKYDPHFNYFLDSLDRKFTRWSLKKTLRKRLWRWFCEIRETVKSFKPW